MKDSPQRDPALASPQAPFWENSGEWRSLRQNIKTRISGRSAEAVQHSGRARRVDPRQPQNERPVFKSRDGGREAGALWAKREREDERGEMGTPLENPCHGLGHCCQSAPAPGASVCQVWLACCCWECLSRVSSDAPLSPPRREHRLDRDALTLPNTEPQAGWGQEEAQRIPIPARLLGGC